MKIKELQNNRRRFLLQLPALIGVAGLLPKSIFAQDLSESDPVATALCYKKDVTQVDKSNPKCGRFAAGQNCANCQLYTGTAASTSGPCSLFQNKIVPAKAWCNGWVQKAK